MSLSNLTEKHSNKEGDNLTDVRIVHKDELYHYGIKGMKWGHRKNKVESAATERLRSSRNDYKNTKQQAKAQYKQAKKDYRNDPEVQAARKEKAQKTAKVGAAVVATALAAYGAYKLNKYVKTKNGQIAAEKGWRKAQEQFGRDEKYWMEKELLPGQISEKITLNARADEGARKAFNTANEQSFKTAAKNVINYRRSEGKGSLGNLPVAEFYLNEPGNSVTFTKYRR